jgi:hypothetical protein
MPPTSPQRATGCTAHNPDQLPIARCSPRPKRGSIRRDYRNWMILHWQVTINLQDPERRWKVKTNSEGIRRPSLERERFRCSLSANF